MRKNPLQSKLIALLLALLLLCCGSQMALALPEKPQVDAEAYLLLETKSGVELLKSNAEQKIYMASLTKIMTAYVVLNNVSDLQEVVTVPKGFKNAGESGLAIRAGEKHSYMELLYALLVRSANDAAQVLAIGVAGTEPLFVGMMNDTAKALGMDNTHYVNPHGLHDEEHYTTASDLLLLTQKALQNPIFRSIVSTESITLPWNGKELTLKSTNQLYGSYEGIKGVKTGTTKQAGSCLIALCERDGIELLAVALKCKSAFEEMPKLLDYGFSNFEWRQLYRQGESFGSLPVLGGKQLTLPLVLGEGLTMPALKGESTEIPIIDLPQTLNAPIEQGEYIGTLTVHDSFGHEYKLKICAAEAVPEHNFKLSLRKVFQTIFALLT